MFDFSELVDQFVQKRFYELVKSIRFHDRVVNLLEPVAQLALTYSLSTT